MVSKKKKKIILISIISVLLVAIIAISSIFIVKNNKNKIPETPVAEQTSQNEVISNVSNKAIADGNIPANYNGVYEFKTLTLEFAENLNYQEKQALLSNKGVSDVNGLLDLLKQQKLNEIKSTGELLVLYNGNINTSVGRENPTYVPESAGTYVGDDNLALVTITKTQETYYISLNYQSKDAATQVSENSESDGTKLYIFKKIYSKYQPDLVLLNITYEYDLYVVEEEFDKTIYDF